jgi:hypothetical protein
MRARQGLLPACRRYGCARARAAVSARPGHAAPGATPSWGLDAGAASYDGAGPISRPAGGNARPSSLAPPLVALRAAPSAPQAGPLSGGPSAPEPGDIPRPGGHAAAPRARKPAPARRGGIAAASRSSRRSLAQPAIVAPIRAAREYVHAPRHVLMPAGRRLKTRPAPSEYGPGSKGAKAAAKSQACVGMGRPPQPCARPCVGGGPQASRHGLPPPARRSPHA